MKNILLVIYLLAYTQANAQRAPEAGLNMSTYSNIPGPAKTGIRIGVTQNMIYLSENVFLQPSLFYVLNGTNYTAPYAPSNNYYVTLRRTDEKITVHTLEIPLNIMYKHGAPDESGFFLGAGILLNINLAEKYNAGETQYDHFDLLEFGLGANAGYQFSTNRFIRARAQRSLGSSEKTSVYSLPGLNRSYGITIGYYLGQGTRKLHSATDK